MKTKQKPATLQTPLFNTLEAYEAWIKSKPFIDLRCDWAFKYFFSDKEVLKKLINDVLPVEVSDVEYLPNEIPVRDEKDKRSVMDVLCTHKGKKFLLEMQRSRTTDMNDRIIYYGSTLLSNQVRRGDPIYSLNPVYVLCICDYEAKHKSPIPKGKLLFTYELLEADLHEPFGARRLQLLMLELPRLQIMWEETTSNVERWTYLFENFPNFAQVPNENLHGFDKVIDRARMDRLNESEQQDYIKSMASDYEIKVHTMAAYEDGLAQGKVEVAKAMLADGLSPERVAQYAGLSTEEVFALKSPTE